MKETLLNKLGPTWQNMQNSPLASEMLHFASSVIEMNHDITRVSRDPSSLNELVGLSNLMGVPFDYIQPAEVLLKLDEPISVPAGGIKFQSSGSEFTNIHPVDNLSYIRLFAGRFAHSSESLDSVSVKDGTVYIKNTLLSTISSTVKGMSTIGFACDHSESLSWFDLYDVSFLNNSVLWLDDKGIPFTLLSFTPYNGFSKDVIKSSYVRNTFPILKTVIDSLIYPYGFVAKESDFVELFVVAPKYLWDYITTLLPSLSIKYSFVEPVSLDYKIHSDYLIYPAQEDFVKDCFSNLLSEHRRITPEDVDYIRFLFKQKYGFMIDISSNVADGYVI